MITPRRIPRACNGLRDKISGQKTQLSVVRVVDNLSPPVDNFGSWRPWFLFVKNKEKIMDLHLNLKGEYFDRIKAGTKEYEYRLITPYWVKRLEGRTYDNIIIKRGYPKKDDKENIIIRPWKFCKTIPEFEHPHFGKHPVDVYAIKVN